MINMDNDKLNILIEDLKKTLIRNGVKDISSYDKFFDISKKQINEKQNEKK